LIQNIVGGSFADAGLDQTVAKLQEVTLNAYLLRKTNTKSKGQLISVSGLRGWKMA